MRQFEDLQPTSPSGGWGGLLPKRPELFIFPGGIERRERGVEEGDRGRGVGGLGLFLYKGKREEKEFSLSNPSDEYLLPCLKGRIRI